MGTISSEKIPNNIGLTGDAKLQKALESWQPDYIKWWREIGPEAVRSLDLEIGSHAIEIEYRELSGIASVAFEWRPPDAGTWEAPGRGFLHHVR